jgi:hypothetical protein
MPFKSKEFSDLPQVHWGQKQTSPIVNATSALSAKAESGHEISVHEAA